MNAGRRWAPSMSGVVVLALALTGCASSIDVPRTDWGAITPDAQIRVTRTDGSLLDLTEVVVSTEALEGVQIETRDPVRLPLDEIDFLESRSGDRTGAILATIAAIGATIAIVQALGEDGTAPEPTPLPPREPVSCPFIYSFDGDEYRLDSETFAGAITQGLQRTDLDNLDHLRPVAGRYRMQLVNQRPETQYTDLVRLVVIDHADGTDAYPDVTGAVHVFRGGAPPLAAQGLHGGDATEELSAPDGDFWTGAPVATARLDDPASLRDGVELVFPRPASDRALLAVRAQNTELAPFALRTFLELHGDGLVDWYRRVDRDPMLQASLRGWVLREGTLHVSVRKGERWELQDALMDVGPNLPKIQVARLDLSDIEGDEIEVRVESARGLWTLDWIVLGEADTERSRVRELEPQVATGPNDRDVSAPLSSVDEVYFTALPGDRVDLVFSAPGPPPTGMRRTTLVRTRGFYHIYVRETREGDPALIERILTEPLFGNRYMLARLRAIEASLEEAGGRASRSQRGHR